MSVRQRKYRDPQTGAEAKVWWIDVMFEHPDGRRERVRRRSPVQTKRGAEHYEREVRQRLLDGTFGRKEAAADEMKAVPVFRGFSEEFMDSYVATNNKPSEQRSKRMILERHLVPAFGRLRLDEIGPREIERYKVGKLGTGSSGAGLLPKTVNNHLTVLRKLLDVAHEWGLLEQVPRVKWLRPPKPEFDFLDFDEAGRLVAGADPEWRTMVLLALRTGLRQGELLGLRWEDVDLVAGRLLVRRSRNRGHEGSPKSNRSREVPLSGEALSALKAYRHLKGPYVFSHPDGRPLGDGDCKWALWRACRRAGLRRIGWHVLRHTFASHLVMRGVPLKAVQELLGHSTMEMTMRYAHLSPDARREAVSVLDAPAPRHDSGTEDNGRSS